MLQFARGVKVYLACKPMDMRRGFDGLAADVAQTLRSDPYICVGRGNVAEWSRGFSILKILGHLWRKRGTGGGLVVRAIVAGSDEAPRARFRDMEAAGVATQVISLRAAHP